MKHPCRYASFDLPASTTTKISFEMLDIDASVEAIATSIGVYFIVLFLSVSLFHFVLFISFYFFFCYHYDNQGESEHY